MPVFSADNVQHRWVRGDAVIDVLIPRHLGLRASRRRGALGGRTIETPGAQKVLNRTEKIAVRAGDRESDVLRPSLVGAIIGKAAAFTVMLDRDRDRHLGDLVVLASLLRSSDLRGASLDTRERALVINAVGAARANPAAWAYVANGSEALSRALLLTRRS
ncbi:hypothetical protein QFZ21_002880 [Microbacterium sp. W4I20]|nr:hypothetical protein [Microbacterium sp. W4I20]